MFVCKTTVLFLCKDLFTHKCSLYDTDCVWSLSLGPLHLFIYALPLHPHVDSSRCVCLHSHFIYFLFFPKAFISFYSVPVLVPYFSGLQCNFLSVLLDSNF